jgi:chromosome segregation ATPase
MDPERSEQAISTDAERALALQEQIEILQEMLKSQNLYLEYKDQQLLELKKELRDAKEEIDWMNQEVHNMYQRSPTLFNCECLPRDMAIELAKIILANEQPTQDSLAQLLSAIYGCTVESWELEQRQMPSQNECTQRIRADSEQLHAQYKQLQEQLREMGTRYVTLKAVYNKFKAQYYEQMNPKISDKPRAKSRFGAGFIANYYSLAEAGNHY